MVRARTGHCAGAQRLRCPSGGERELYTALWHGGVPGPVFSLAALQRVAASATQLSAAAVLSHGACKSIHSASPFASLSVFVCEFSQRLLLLTWAFGWRTQALILSGTRTPSGSLLGSLSSLKTTELGSHVISHALQRAKVKGDQVDEVRTRDVESCVVRVCSFSSFL